LVDYYSSAFAVISTNLICRLQPIATAHMVFTVRILDHIKPAATHQVTLAEGSGDLVLVQYADLSAPAGHVNQLDSLLS